MKRMILASVLSLLTLFSYTQTHSKKSTVRLIRNATVTINYAGKKILVDPMFSSKGALWSIRGKVKSPMVDLVVPIEEIIRDVELVLVTHSHPDHFDKDASKALDKSVKLINQPADKEFFINEGFKNSVTLENSTVWNGITITRTEAQHGSGRMLREMGKSSGFVLQAPGQPTIYIVGDAIWTEEIYQNMQQYKPDYIIVNSGGAVFPEFEATPIIMDADQTLSLIQESGTAKIIAVHMDAIDHCLTTREVLKQKAKEYNIGKDKLIIPEDGEKINL